MSPDGDWPTDKTRRRMWTSSGLMYEWFIGCRLEGHLRLMSAWASGKMADKQARSQNSGGEGARICVPAPKGSTGVSPRKNFEKRTRDLVHCIASVAQKSLI